MATLEKNSRNDRGKDLTSSDSSDYYEYETYGGEFSDYLAEPEEQEVSYYKGKFKLNPLGYSRNNKSPEDSASVYSKIMFTWLNPIIYRGKGQKVIGNRELPWLRHKDSAMVNKNRLRAMWEEELHRVRTHHKDSDGNVDWSSLKFMTLMSKYVGPEMYYSIPIKAIYDVIQYISPVVMSTLIDWVVQLQVDEESGIYRNQWVGLWFVLVYFVIGVFQALIICQYFHNQNKVGLRLKTGVMGVVYDKLLRTTDYSLSGMMDPDGIEWTDDETKTPTKSGQVLTLLSVDSTKLYMFCTYCHTLWSAPFQIIIGTIILIVEVQWSGLIFIPVALVSIPAAYLILRRLQKAIQQTMIEKDKRLSKESESINSMKVVKMYGWEKAVINVIDSQRTEELKHMKRRNIMNIASTVIWNLIPALSVVCTFAVKYGTGGNIDAGTAYSIISVFNLLRFPLAMLPNLMSQWADIRTSLRRVMQFLLCPEFATPKYDREGGKKKMAVELCDKNLDEEEYHLIHPDGVPLLKNVHAKAFEYRHKTHTVLIGRVGSGKTSLLSSLTGGLRYISKSKAGDLSSHGNGERLSKEILKNCEVKVDELFCVNGTISYVPQTPWIINATVRNNIIMNQPFDMNWYKQVVVACELVPDLRTFVDGDLTEIGEKGINLSGGQRQRIALARAVYQKADINLFDDILSALDSQVGKKIVERVINGILKNKTVIMVSHSVQYLSYFDRVIFLSGPEIRYDGKPGNKLNDDHDFREMVVENMERSDSIASEVMSEPGRIEMTIEEENLYLDNAITDTSLLNSRRYSTGSFVHSSTMSIREDEVPYLTAMSHVSGIDEHFEKGAHELTTKDLLFLEKVDKNDYIYYIKRFGILVLSMVIVFMILSFVAAGGSSYWVGIWTSDVTMNVWFGLGIYTALQVANVIFMSVSYLFVMVIGALRATRAIHDDLLYRIMFAKQSFFDATPAGRLENLFSREVFSLDNLLPQSIYSTLQFCINLIVTLILICVGLWWFVIPLVPIILIFVYWAWIFVPASRQMKRIESKSSAPVMTICGEAIDGAASIRACGLQEVYLKKAFDSQDYSCQTTYALNGCYRWLSARFELMSASIVTMACFLVVVLAKSISSASVGLAISYALSTGQAISWTVRQFAELENAAVSVERIREYIVRDEIKDPSVRGDVVPIIPADNWPSQGKIEFQNIYLRYKTDLPLILKGLNLTIEAGKKIGVVGRTGAGKSTLFLSLLRMVPIESGAIIVDGHNIDHIDLTKVRNKMSIIPQEPVMFAGTVKYNIDPYGEYTDKELYDCLKRSHLTKFIESKEEGLEYVISEGGSNISAGERQLICIARALLKRSNILLLDEATSSVDRETDAKIQETIRTEFSHCTILTIAHRINTILDYDEVVVIDQGVVAEKGSPTKLLKDDSTLFASIASAME